MQTPLEKLARRIHRDIVLGEYDSKAPVGQLANRYGERAGRISDALDMLKLLYALQAIPESPITYSDG